MTTAAAHAVAASIHQPGGCASEMPPSQPARRASTTSLRNSSRDMYHLCLRLSILRALVRVHRSAICPESAEMRPLPAFVGLVLQGLYACPYCARSNAAPFFDCAR